MPFTLLRHRDHTDRRSPIRVVLSALVLALLIPLTTVLATPASAVDGTVSGIVYDEAGDGVAGIEISAYKMVGGSPFAAGTVLTGPDGAYEFTVSEGDYKVGAFLDDNYLPSYFDGHTTLANADLIPVAAGAPAEQINLTVSLAPTGVISGIVTSDEDDNPIQGIDVTVFKLINEGNPAWMAYRTDVTSIAGGYAVTLPHGTYKVGFADVTGDYESEFYDNVASLDNADELVLDDDSEVANASLGRGGWISGTVTALDDGAPIENVEVSLFAYVDAGDDSYWEEVKFTSTDAQGEYLIYAPAGTYHVGFNGSGVDFASEFYNDAATVDGGTDVEISQAGVGTNSIDATLGSRGQLSGTVTAGGAPAAGIEVATYRNVGDEADPVWEPEDFTDTDAGGNYELITDGIVRVGFLDPTGTYAPEFFDNADSVSNADDVEIPQGGLKDGIDATLNLTGHITGKVSNPDGIPLPEVYVDLYRNEGTQGSPSWEPLDTRQTACNGTFDLPAGPGTYRVGFYGTTGAEIFYDAASTVDNGTNVVVVGSNATPNINGELDEAPVECVNQLELLTDPVITGTPKVGQTLQVSNGTWDPAPTSYSYTWFSNTAPIPGATSATYVLKPSDANEYVYAVVRAEKDGYDDVNASSADFGPIDDAVVNTALPKITGKAVVGSTLTATPGSWLPSTAPVTYQWLASGVAIPGATGKTFKPSTAQLGKKLSVRVTATKVGAESGVATSAVTTIVMVQPTMALAKKVKKTKVILTIQVKAVGVVAVVGKVKVFRKSKLLKTVSLKAGKVVVKLKKQPKGKAKYKATYVGSSPVLAVSKSIKVAV